MAEIRMGADIGGTFTDIALEKDGQIHSAKVLTTADAPENGVLQGAQIVAEQAGVALSDIALIIHGTTLATNALIERRGAKTALITTEGFRDVIEMRTENRFEQYDLNIVLPPPLIDRKDRYPVGGRIDMHGRELAPLDEDRLAALGDILTDKGYEALAIGFIHAYANTAHEERAREILAARLPGVSISLSAEVSPQMREFERFNTVCANSYIRPMMDAYLGRLEKRLQSEGATCPLFLMHSGGGLIDVATARAFPVRLVESGPAGGAIFAADYAARFGIGKTLSYDMGGTTAKICLIEGSAPRTSQSFEVARTYRFKKGSGMPISIPVIEMVEIGAGGGSLASVDAMRRIQVGPESAGSEPGPACYDRGGEKPAVTDADLVLGRIDPDNFAGGDIRLSTAASTDALQAHVADPMGLTSEAAAFGVSEVVDENMANAARVHAVENGEDISANTMIAFGGAAPLHAARLCSKLGIDRCLIPPGAGVGSAIGFLRAPFAYEAVRTLLFRLSTFDGAAATALITELTGVADSFVAKGAGDTPRSREITAFMRYRGQGWEIPVSLPDRAFADSDAAALRDWFGEAYTRFFGRTIDAMGDLEVEIASWSVKVAAELAPPSSTPLRDDGPEGDAPESRPIFDPDSGVYMEAKIAARDALKPGDRLTGPAVIIERETATIIADGYRAVMQDDGSILMMRKDAA